MIALEVSSAARRPPYGSIGGAIRNTVHALLRIDPGTRYWLCHRLSRARRGHLFRADAPNARVRVIQDPLNALLLPRARLFHAMGVYVPRTPRVPKLVTVHDLNAVRNVAWVRREWHATRSARIRDAVARADHVVTYSAFTADEVAEEYRFPRERVHPVPLGVDTTVFRPGDAEELRRTRAEHGDYVIAIGLLTPRKNFVRLVEAMARLEKLRFVLVGQGKEAEREVEDALDRTGVRARTTRLARLPQPELVRLIAGARVCAVPSLYEGFGLPVIEAMACGVPVVCSTSPPLPEVADGAARLVDATDVEALADALRRVVEDAALAAELRERGLARARAMSWEATARRLRALYREVAGV